MLNSQSRDSLSSGNGSIDSNHSTESDHKIPTRRFRRILHSFSRKSTQKSNSDKIERYLRHCVNDSNIKTCSLFKEFLQPQRDEDYVIPKDVVHSYVEQQSSLVIDQPPLFINSRREITPPADNVTEENDSILNSSSISFTSFPSPISNGSHTQQQQTSAFPNANNSSIFSDYLVTIQDFQLIKVIGRGCMGKVNV